MSKPNGKNVDPWCELLTEEVTIDGVKASVRGLSIRELTAVTKPCKGDDNAIAEALVVACVTRVDGKELDFTKMPASIFRMLSDAVMRANGFEAPNSKATGADVSYTA